MAWSRVEVAVIGAGSDGVAVSFGVVFTNKGGAVVNRQSLHRCFRAARPTAHRGRRARHGSGCPGEPKIATETPADLLSFPWNRGDFFIVGWVSDAGKFLRVVSVNSSLRSSLTSVTSSQLGHVPPAPSRWHGRAQSGHHCSAR